MEHEAVHAIGPGIKEAFALANLLVVILIIYLAGRKGIAASLKDRSATISKRLVDAKIELEKMRAESQRIQKEVANIHIEKKRIIDSVSEEGRKMAQAMVVEARATADRILADAKLAAENEMRSATNKLRDKLVRSALAQSVQIVSAGAGESKELRNQIHEKLFEKLISDLPENFDAKKETSCGV